MLILSLLITNSLIEEDSCKHSTISPSSFYYVKIVFIPLIEVMAIYEQFFIIYIGKLNLQKIFPRIFEAFLVAIQIFKRYYILVFVYIISGARAKLKAKVDWEAETGLRSRPKEL